MMKTKTAVESLREVVQDLLVPELKALKVEMEGLRTETRSSIDSLRSEVKLRDENQSRATSMLAESTLRAIQALSEEMRLRDEKQSQAIGALSDKMGDHDGGSRAPAAS